MRTGAETSPLPSARLRIPVPRAGETLDSLGGGRIVFFQHQEGYRVSVDPVLLARFVSTHADLAGPTLDLGTGVGIIPLLLAIERGARVEGLELQPALFELAQRNVALNRCQRSVFLTLGDWRRVASRYAPGRYRAVTANPPYLPAVEWRPGSHSERAMARHELAGGLSTLVAAAAQLLATEGSLFVIYPAGRLAELIHALRRRRLEPKRLRMVHPRPGEPAKRVLLQAVRSGRPGLAIDPPLVLHGPVGHAYSAEVLRMLR